MALLGYLLFFLGIGIGLLIIPFGLPGVAVIFLCCLVYALWTDFQAAIGLNFFIVLCVLTVVAETADNWLMALGARKFGASRGAIWLSLLGGFLGALFIGPVLSLILGLLGPFIAAFLGAFLTVVLFELYKRKEFGEALRAGWGTLLGRMAGVVFKLTVGTGMAIAIAFALLF